MATNIIYGLRFYWVEMLKGKTKSTRGTLYQYSLGLLIGVLCVLYFSSITQAQQLTATIQSQTGEVMVSFQEGKLISGIMGTVLRTGDAIQTYTGANVMLNISDGSKLQLGENTNLTLTTLSKEPQTGISKPSVTLFWGRLRSILSPVYQTSGSSFIVRTPNALVGVQSSEVDVEVMYEPGTKTTVVLAHEFDVRVTNLVTGVSFPIPQGHSGIIHESVIQEIAQILDLSSLTDVQQQTAQISALNGEVLISLQGQNLRPAINGTVLRPGDAVRTGVGATVALTLSDGSVLTLGENTSINIHALGKDPQTGVRTSRLDLHRGGLRTTLAEDYQESDSSFTVQTPNVSVAMASLKPDTEVMYDPNRSITTVIAHKSDVVITHRLADISAIIPEGHSGIIHNHVIQEVARILESSVQIPQLPEVTPESQTEETAPSSEQKAPKQ